MKYLIYIFIIISIFSCSTKKNIYYFQDAGSIVDTSEFTNLTIQKGDILDIQIKALNPESVAIFQKEVTQNNMNSREQRILSGYLVGGDGKIELPILGKLSVSGYTTKELSDLIKEKLVPYVKDPIVKVLILNFKVSVLGEVANPNTFNLIEEQISLIQLLGMAGDLTMNGDRTNILILRQTDDGQITHRVDLTQSDFIDSPFYYMSQNDIVYVYPNYARVKSSGLINNIGTLTGLISFLISLTIISGR